VDAQLRYVAIHCEHPDQTAAFYCKWFGMRELGRSSAGDISVTDGWVNMSLLAMQPGSTATRGLSHYGIAVSSIDELKRRLATVAPGTAFEPEPGGVHFGEYRIRDANGYPVSISERRFNVPELPLATARLRHISLSVPGGPDLMKYYVDAFGFRELGTSIRRRTEGKDAYPFLFVGDGEINLALLPYQAMIKTPERELTDAHREHGWFGHIGFVVPDAAHFARELDAKAYGVDMAECRIYDPEGCHLDLSQVKGFEVDLNKWVRAA
jgi:catechol 2,3-dioxygenase-like lactoylglutathione lyase family enzyme